MEGVQYVKFAIVPCKRSIYRFFTLWYTLAAASINQKVNQSIIMKDTLIGGYRVHVTDPDVAKHVIVSNNKNYRRQDVLKQMLPDLGNGLITANGRDHAIQRKQLNPFFSSSKIKGYLPVFAQKAEELVQVSFWFGFFQCVLKCLFRFPV